MSSLWTQKPHFCGGRAFLKAFSQGTATVLCLLTLASCGQSTPAGYPGSSESSAQSGTLQPLTAPPNPENRPPVPGTTGAPKTADGLPALQIKNVNTQLFSQRMSDEADRLDRLENAVQELRNDFDAMAPAIVRLVAIEGDIQGLIKQLETLTGTEPMPSSDIPPIEESELNEPLPEQNPSTQALPPLAVPSAPQNILPDEDSTAAQEYLPPLPDPAQDQAAASTGSPVYPAGEPPAPVDSAQAPSAVAAPPVTSMAQTAPVAPAKTTGRHVMDIRIGEHPGKTRIVLDVSGKASFTADVDNQEKILVIEIPSAGWDAAAQQSFASSPIIASYRVEKSDDGGTMLIIQLKKAVSITYKGTMDDAATGGQRLIIDLSPAS